MHSNPSSLLGTLNLKISPARLKFDFYQTLKNIYTQWSKPRQLGIQNQIANDSESKLSKFRWRLYDDSDFKVEIVSLIMILISFQLNLTKFDLFRIKKLKKMTSMSIRLKSKLKAWKLKFNWKNLYISKWYNWFHSDNLDSDDEIDWKVN